MSSIAVVKSIVGQVFALSPDGVRRLLIEGDRLFAGDQVITGPEGMVSLELSDGRTLDLGRDSQWTAVDDAQPAVAAANTELSVSELQQAISLGLDPTAELEATAAGGGGIGDDPLLAFPSDRAGRRCENAEKHLHQGRLAGAIFAEQGHHLARIDPKTRFVEGAHTGEGLDDLGQLQNG